MHQQYILACQGAKDIYGDANTLEAGPVQVRDKSSNCMEQQYDTR